MAAATVSRKSLDCIFKPKFTVLAPVWLLCFLSQFRCHLPSVQRAYLLSYFSTSTFLFPVLCFPVPSLLSLLLIPSPGFVRLTRYSFGFLHEMLICNALHFSHFDHEICPGALRSLPPRYASRVRSPSCRPLFRAHVRVVAPAAPGVEGKILLPLG